MGLYPGTEDRLKKFKENNKEYQELQRTLRKHQQMSAMMCMTYMVAPQAAVADATIKGGWIVLQVGAAALKSNAVQGLFRRICLGSSFPTMFRRIGDWLYRFWGWDRGMVVLTDRGTGLIAVKGADALRTAQAIEKMVNARAGIENAVQQITQLSANVNKLIQPIAEAVKHY